MVQQATTDPSAHEGQPERLRMTYDEFQDWYGEGRRGEWVDGEVIPFLAPKTIHQQISWFLGSLIGIYAQVHALGTLLPQPEMRLRDGGSYREPDLVFVAAEHAARITVDRVDGPADLVVEIVSEDSVQRDRKQKFQEYADAGIREYWVVDPRPLRHAVFAYVLDDEGIFEQTRPDDGGRIVSSVLPGFWIDPAWLWQNPTPSVAEVLRAIDPLS